MSQICAYAHDRVKDGRVHCIKQFLNNYPASLNAYVYQIHYWCNKVPTLKLSHLEYIYRGPSKAVHFGDLSITDTLTPEMRTLLY